MEGRYYLEPRIMVLCDGEEDYAQHLANYLQKEKEFPWQIYLFTNVSELYRFSKSKNIDLILIAESIVSEQIIQTKCNIIILLNESGTLVWEELKNVNKYQPADAILKELLTVYLLFDQSIKSINGEKKTTKLIGMYSPVKRCLQSYFAISMAQILSLTHRTLYLSCEYYSGHLTDMYKIQALDLSDLLYFLHEKDSKFLQRFKTIMNSAGTMDYIYPMTMGENLLYVKAEEWIELLHNIFEMNEYDYVIIDLCESIQGLFRILQECYKVFTITKDDPIAQRKIDQYEHLLSISGCDIVKDKTLKLELPLFKHLPVELLQYTKGELAEYIQNIIKTELI